MCLSSWVALSTHFLSVWVVSGVDVGHFGSSWGALGRVLGNLLGLLGGLGGPGTVLKAVDGPKPTIDKSGPAKNRFLDRLGGPRGRQDGPKTAP